MRSPHFVVLLLVGMATVCLGASKPAADEYSRRVWRVQDGLPQNRIQAISQTSEGYLWIGTSGGLARFDGVRFVVFDRSSNTAIRDDSILALCPSRDGSLWIGTEGGGLLHYRNGSFQQFGAKEGLTNGFVRAIHEDGRGTLWVGTDRGFFRLEGSRLIRLDGHGDLPYVAVQTIREDRERRLWVGGSAGLLSMDGGTLARLPGLAGPVTSILGARDGALWIAAGADVRQLRNGILDTVHRWDGTRVVSLAEDHEGSIWMGTASEGLIRFRGQQILPEKLSGIVPGRTVLSVFEDREQNLWVGTQDGLSRLSKTAVHLLTESDGLPEDSVSTVYQDRGGSLWIATATRGLYRTDGRRAAPFELPVKGGPVTVRTVFEDSQGVFWFGTAERGILRLSGGRMTGYTIQDGLRSNSIRHIFEDRAGTLWVATGSGLSRWTGKGFLTYYIEDGLAYGSVRVVAESRDGDVLVGTDGGLSRIHDGKFVHDAALAELGSEPIWAIVEDADSGLWAGTRGGGLFRVKRGKVSRFTSRDGLLSNSIYQLIEDRDGRLWMSSTAGVFSANRKDLDAIADGLPGPIAVVPYGTAGGLETSQMNGGAQPAGCRTAAGELWFASVKGAVRIDPGQLRNSRPAPVIVESILADERPMGISGAVRVPPGRGKLEIHYTACNLQSPERLSFKHILEGFDEGWTPGSSHRTAYYTNLPPGHYVFRVVATDGADPQHASEAAVALVWEPHFYQTFWLYGLCAVLLCLCAWAALRFYARQTKARYAVLLAERTRLAREMHDTVIQGCVGVSTLLEAVSTTGDSNGEVARALLDEARSQVRMTLDEARQAVWDLRHDAFGEPIVGTLRDFARQMGKEKGIPVEAEVVGSPAPLEGMAGRNLMLVAREAVRNALAHGNPGRIKIRICFDPNEVRLEVSDDGCGFSPRSADGGDDGHYGIIGMRERVEQLGGSLQLRSSPGQGTMVSASLPLRRNRRHPANASHE